MEAIQYFVLDAFTRTRFAGNPAGVVFHEDRLTHTQMQSVAGELGLESAFLTLMPGGEADYRVAYYTGVSRVPLCGHDTVAAAALLALKGWLPPSGAARFATDVGTVTVAVSPAGMVTMQQAQPAYGAVAERGEVAAALGLDAADIVGSPQVVSTGSPFLFVPVRSRTVLNSLPVPGPALTAFLTAQMERPLGAYVWTRETADPSAFAHARCFAPGVGLPEDPVTGSASGALGAYLLRHGLARTDANGLLAFSTEQGYAMGRPGHAEVRLEVSGGEVSRVSVAGEAVLVAEGRLWV